MVKISKSLIALFVACAFITGIAGCGKTESTHDKDIKAAKEAVEKAGEKAKEPGKEPAAPAKK